VERQHNVLVTAQDVEGNRLPSTQRLIKQIPNLLLIGGYLWCCIRRLVS